MERADALVKEVRAPAVLEVHFATSSLRKVATKIKVKLSFKLRQSIFAAPVQPLSGDVCDHLPGS